MIKTIVYAGFVAGAAALAGCSGGSGARSVVPPPNVAPAPNVAPPPITPSTQQVVSVAIPTSAIGRENDPVFGLVGGFTQTTFSQVLGFAPGMQIMIRNAESSRPHTLGDLGAASFPATGAALSLSPTNSATFASGWQSGTLNPGQIVGPITLSTGTYYIGCAYHYLSDTMRDVLVVASGAVPGPQATQQPGGATPTPTNAPGGNGY